MPSTVEGIESAAGKRVVVTGANSGIGFCAALELARAGATVIMACRDPARGQAALDSVRSEMGPGAADRVSLEQLDLASLASVRAFAGRVAADSAPIDLLVNNAGVMFIPDRRTTTDGFEMQVGTNHLGHFALTLLLLPALRRSSTPRVVVVSSGMAARASRDFLGDLMSERSYSPQAAYSVSKLSNLLFADELRRRAPWLSVAACHPGASDTNLAQHSLVIKILTKVIAQSAQMGALPTLMASVAELPADSLAYFGPSHCGLRGYPQPVALPDSFTNVKPGVPQALWQRSVELTGVHFEA
eukprot:m51a1_g7327 hypothetical protein (301) ;mRNA; f:160308-161210